MSIQMTTDPHEIALRRIESDLEPPVFGEPLQERGAPPPPDWDRIAGSSGFLHEYCRLFNGRNESPASLHFATGLATLAACLGRSRWVAVGARHLHPNLYVLMVAQSGSFRKTTALNIGRKICQSSELCSMLPDTFSDEALLDILDGKPVAGFVSEFKNLAGVGAKKYCSGLTGRLTDLWDTPSEFSGGFRQNAEKGKKSCCKVVVNPILTLIAASTPDYLQVNSEDVAGGFLGRFLVFAPDCQAPIIPRPQSIPNEAFDHLAGMLKDRGNGPGPLTLEQAACQLFDRRYEEEVRKQRCLKLAPAEASAASRMSDHWLKFSILLAVSEDPAATTISAGVLERAIALETYCLANHARTLGNLADNPFEKQRRKVLDIVERQGECKMRDLYRSIKRRVGEVQELVNSLAMAGEVHVEGRPSANGQEVLWVLSGPEPEVPVLPELRPPPPSATERKAA